VDRVVRRALAVVLVVRALAVAGLRLVVRFAVLPGFWAPGVVVVAISSPYRSYRTCVCKP
jgi:hypothetical protein